MRRSALISPFLFTCLSLSVYLSLSVLGFSLYPVSSLYTVCLLKFLSNLLTLTHYLDFKMVVFFYFVALFRMVMLQIFSMEIFQLFNLYIFNLYVIVSKSFKFQLNFYPLPAFLNITVM